MTRLTGNTNPGRRAGESTHEFEDSEKYPRQAADSVAVVGTDLCYRFANGKYADWFGLDPEKIIGRHVTEVGGREIFEKKTNSWTRRWPARRSATKANSSNTTANA